MLPHKKSTLTRFPNACKHPEGLFAGSGSAACSPPVPAPIGSNRAAVLV